MRWVALAAARGPWTAMLADRARTLTAVDGSPEMLALAARRAGGEHVRFERADLFEWRPERGYDAVFFGFWLSHVPDEGFEAFWAKVADALSPGGHALFVDDAGRPRMTLGAVGARPAAPETPEEQTPH